MQSVASIYKPGIGPSSSHSMGPKKAAEQFVRALAEPINRIEVELYGSLAATGKGHLTDKAISEALRDYEVSFTWKPEEFLPYHPNAMRFEAFRAGRIVGTWLAYSIGGGEIDDGTSDDVVSVMNETGRNLLKQYRETSLGGLAAIYHDTFEGCH